MSRRLRPYRWLVRYTIIVALLAVAVLLYALISPHTEYIISIIKEVFHHVKTTIVSNYSLLPC